MPDHALDPDSLVGRLLKVEQLEAPAPEPIPAPPPQAPLWQRMHHAACTAPGYPLAGSCIAAQLLVIADQIVPEAAEPSVDVLEGLGPEERLARAIEWERWSVRQQIRQELAAEARKADLAGAMTTTPCRSASSAAGPAAGSPKIFAPPTRGADLPG
jgi:hypothetical protein